MADCMVGLLGESENDCRIVTTVFQRILEERQVSVAHYRVIHRAGNGASKLLGNCQRWIRELSGRGCRHIIVLHDRDRHDEAQLRAKLNAVPVPPGIRRLVCIPVEEIEAWFFSSEQAMRLICGDAAQSRERPETIRNPKEELTRLSRAQPGRTRYSPNDGPRIAEVLELDVCAMRCPAFKELRGFVVELLGS
jgi:hypothetical protein